MIDDEALRAVMLTNAQRELRALTAKRTERVARAKKEIAEANRSYDREATRLNRRIRKLTPAEMDTTAATVTRRVQPTSKDRIQDRINRYNREKGIPEVEL